MPELWKKGSQVAAFGQGLGEPQQPTPQSCRHPATKEHLSLRLGSQGASYASQLLRRNRPLPARRADPGERPRAAPGATPSIPEPRAGLFRKTGVSHPQGEECRRRTPPGPFLLPEPSQHLPRGRLQTCATERKGREGAGPLPSTRASRPRCARCASGTRVAGLAEGPAVTGGLLTVSLSFLS